MISDLVEVTYTNSGDPRDLDSIRAHLKLNPDLYGLLEATYKDIQSLIDPLFLNHKSRADAITGIRLQKILPNGSVTFLVPSQSLKGRYYTNVVKFKDWDAIARDSEMKAMDRARLLISDSDIEVLCTCPAFLYYGYKYILTQYDAAISKENRRPVIRNPRERGSVCKHLDRVLKVLPFYASDIASYISKNFG